MYVVDIYEVLASYPGSRPDQDAYIAKRYGFSVEAVRSAREDLETEQILAMEREYAAEQATERQHEGCDHQWSELR
jgi:hypothetical protein